MSKLESSNPEADVAMARYAMGDDSAFGVLFDALTPRLYAFIRRFVRDDAQAEDLVQHTYIQIHCARGDFIVGSRVTPWAFSIIRRLFLDQTRRNRFERPTPGDELERESAPELACQEDFVHARQLERLFHSQLAQLPPAQQSALELVYYGGMTHAEAAQVLGVTKASITLRLVRAIQSLHDALERSGLQGLQQ